MKRLILLLCCCLFAVWSIALPPDRKVEQLGLVIITSKHVQEELKLTSTQMQKIVSEFRIYEAKANELFKNNPTGSERERKIREMQGLQDDVSKRVLDVLDSKQIGRFRQLVLQVKGVWGVLIPEVSRELKLSSTQIKKIEGLEVGLGKKLSELEKKRQKQIEQIPGPKDPSNTTQREAYKKKVLSTVAKYKEIDRKVLLEADRKAQSKALTYLTKAQRQQWDKMLGTKPKFIKEE